MVCVFFSQLHFHDHNQDHHHATFQRERCKTVNCPDLNKDKARTCNTWARTHTKLSNRTCQVKLREIVIVTDTLWHRVSIQSKNLSVASDRYGTQT